MAATSNKDSIPNDFQTILELLYNLENPFYTYITVGEEGLYPRFCGLEY
jgi:hypothetical protein